mgnify:CR=1 FL=1|tara:strand:- start:2303 stop:4060 length:1758 start_codon:yes stop_codon:yes gene_type:complete
MIYLNLGHNKSNKKISTHNFNFEYFENNKDIQIFYDDTKFIIIDGFFFEPRSISKEFSCKHSDNHAEIIFNLDEKDIESFLKKVDGFFNLLIVNTVEESLKAYSDHVGSKSIFFTYLGNRLFLSDNIQFLLNKSHRFQLNKAKVTEYFSLMNNFGGETFYKEIYEINARECIHFGDNGFKRREYFNFKAVTNNLTIDQNAKLLRKSFLRSVKNCLNYYDAKSATALSGGLDSSSITSVAKFLDKKEIVAKTVTFNNEKKSYELDYSRNVSAEIGVKQDIIELCDTGCISDLKYSINIFAEPKNLVNGYIHHEIFKNLKANDTEVYLDGFGGDSVIDHGYTLFLNLAKEFRFKELIRLDKLIHRNKGAKYRLSRTIKKYIIPSFFSQRFLWFLDSIRPTKNIYKLLESKLTSRFRFKNLYDELIKRYGSYPNSFEKSSEEWHLMNIKSTQITSSIRDANTLARHYDIRILFPFLSKELMQLSLEVPVNQKLFNGIDRYVFRKAMDGIVPRKILERHTKSDLSTFSKKEVMDINAKKLVEKIDKRCKSLFKETYIKENLLKKRADFTEIYQIYEFVAWLEKNENFLE